MSGCTHTSISLSSLVLITKFNKKLVHFKILAHKAIFGCERRKLVLKCHNRRIPLNLARKGKEKTKKKDKIKNIGQSVPRLFVSSNTITKPISSTSSTITRNTSNESIENSSNGQGFVSDVENQVTTETILDFTKEHKDKDITDECDFLFNSSRVNCGQVVEMEESDGCLYENGDYKYHYEKQKISENKMEFEYSNSDNSNVKSCLELNIKILERDFESK